MNFEAFIAQCEQDCAARFSQIDAQSLRGTRRVLDAFAQHHVAARQFAPTTGYG